VSVPPVVSTAVARGVGLYSLEGPSQSSPCRSEGLALASEFACPALQDEEDALLGARRAVELKSEPAPRESNASKEEYYDEATGRRLPPDLVRAARREEVNVMLGWKTWERVDRAEVWRRSRRQPLKTRWVDVNKGDEQKPDVRSRLVAKEIAFRRSDDFFAATPPLEALRLLLSDLASRLGRGTRSEIKMMVIDAKKAHLHAMAGRELFIELPPERGRRLCSVASVSVRDS